MVINQQSAYFEVFPFIENMSRLVKGLIRVEVRRNDKIESVGSGWMITDDLVIVPEFFVTQDDNFLCFISAIKGNKEVVAKKVNINSLSTNEKSEGISVLRLQTPFAGRALELNVSKILATEQVCILHHPEGRDQAVFSLGKVLSTEGNWLKYDANTSPGSSGAPVISIKTWKIAAMHVKGDAKDGNSGLAISNLLDQLRSTKIWNEVATFHHIADTTGSIPLNVGESRIKKISALYDNADMLSAALSWSFNSLKLPMDVKKNIESFVTDTVQPEWRIRPLERQRILKAVSNLKNFKLDKTIWRSADDTAQQVLDRILAGGPYDLNSIDEGQLPYWLQAVRWFDGIIHDIPSAAEVNTVLEKKRMRSRLDTITSGFYGRKNELREIDAWYNNSSFIPLLITGIGGMGKSALIAFFAKLLPVETVLIWLDFDRPDLAPDDALSVLNSIMKQTVLQLPGLNSQEFTNNNWEIEASSFGRLVASSISGMPSPLMVLDGFEIAQYVRNYYEIWRVLGLIKAEIPGLHIIVSGRSPVKSLIIGNVPAKNMVLDGFSKDDSRQWLKHQLKQKDVIDEPFFNQVIELSAGIPLRLKLAARLINSGENISDLSKDLPKALIDGYLYQRILNRLIDPSLISLAKDLLVLRKCDEKMLTELFPNKMPEGSTSQETFEKLSREMALVGETENFSASFVASNSANMLVLRPEVRSATLRLLEMDDVSQVRKVDLKAVDWYAASDLTDVNNLSEYIYHLLRTSKLKKAKEIWNVDCAPLLQTAVNDLPEEARQERQWLLEQTEDRGDSSLGLEVWETQTVKEIRDRLSRGHYHGLSKILNSRIERTASSPLLIYDTLDLLQQGEIEEALKVISKNATDFQVQKDRSILHAFLLAKKGRWEQADHLLSLYEKEENWSAFEDKQAISLGIRAARVRLTVDVAAELRVLENDGLSNQIKDFLPPSDLMLPGLQTILQRSEELESYESGIPLPHYESDLQEFILKLQEKRFNKASLALYLDKDLDRKAIDNWKTFFDNRDIDDKLFQSAIDLAYKGYKRWKLACTDLMLSKFCKIALEKTGVFSPLELGIFASLYPYRGQELMVRDKKIYSRNLDEFIVAIIKKNPRSVFPSINSEMIEKLRNRYLSLLRDNAPRIFEMVGEWFSREDFINNLYISTFGSIGKIGSPQIISLLVYFLSPDPLEIICKKILQLPSTYKFD